MEAVTQVREVTSAVRLASEKVQVLLVKICQIDIFSYYIVVVNMLYMKSEVSLAETLYI